MKRRDTQVSISLSSGFSFQVHGVCAFSSRLTITWFQSRYRAASHFRCKECRLPVPMLEFQSRYRAASHFRLCFFLIGLLLTFLRFNLVIERLLISGFKELFDKLKAFVFQSRYRAASHFRRISTHSGANTDAFQSRYRAASHFRSFGARLSLR